MIVFNMIHVLFPFYCMLITTISNISSLNCFLIWLSAPHLEILKNHMMVHTNFKLIFHSQHKHAPVKTPLMVFTLKAQCANCKSH
uniref:Uncharacterized protein n=1 Tax=Anguilla anguilla TaxID=7936 RepID=A0A0E9XBK8_ANGAN